MRKTTSSSKPKKKKPTSPKRNGKAGKATTKKPEPFKLNAALSRLTAFCGDVNMKCVISNEDTPFFASAFVGPDLYRGRGKTAGGAIKGLWNAVTEVASLEGGE